MSRVERFAEVEPDEWITREDRDAHTYVVKDKLEESAAYWDDEREE